MGRRVPSPDGTYANLEKLAAFKRYDIRNLEDLFKPEGYAILPGLQKAWLGSFRGSHRHRLNMMFLKSWKPVLQLSQVEKRGVRY